MVANFTPSFHTYTRGRICPRAWAVNKFQGERRCYEMRNRRSLALYLILWAGKRCSYSVLDLPGLQGDLVQPMQQQATTNPWSMVSPLGLGAPRTWQRHFPKPFLSDCWGWEEVTLLLPKNEAQRSWRQSATNLYRVVGSTRRLAAARLQTRHLLKASLIVDAPTPP